MFRSRFFEQRLTIQIDNARFVYPPWNVKDQAMLTTNCGYAPAETKQAPTTRATVFVVDSRMMKPVQVRAMQIRVIKPFCWIRSEIHAKAMRVANPNANGIIEYSCVVSGSINACQR